MVYSKYQPKRTSYRYRKPNYVPRAIVKKTSKKTTKPYKLNPVMKKLINQQILKRAESHSQRWNIFNQKSFDSTIGADDIYTLAPALAVGSNPYQRLGDEVRMKSLYLKLHLYVQPSSFTHDSANNSLWIRIMVFYPKDYPNFNDMNATDKSNCVSKLLKVGDFEGNYNGTFDRQSMPINRHLIRPIYTKDIKVVQPIIERNGSELGDWIHSFKPWFMNLTIPIKCRGKKLSFQSGTSAVYPENFNPMIAIGYMSAASPQTSDSTLRVTATAYTYATFDA